MPCLHNHRIVWSAVVLWSAVAAHAGDGWEQYPQKCAMLVVHAHADDGGLFFGGTLPFYAIVRNLPVIDLMLTYSSFNPDVVITHDFNGEYNNPDHMATAIAVTEACAVSGDSASYPDSGVPWTVKKCYVHLYRQNPFFHSWWDDPMEAPGGRTARDVGEEALKKHVSSWGWVAAGFQDSTEYRGLFYTTVGHDVVAKNNFSKMST
jgi:LmbE family N-acetylglucosaminyl deacetylase